jgi:predicted nucleic acid-binding Zn finger protein
MKKDMSEADTLTGIFQAVRAEGTITDTYMGMLQTKFGDQRVNKALEALKESRIKKYVFQPSNRIVWIVIGKERDYLVMPTIDYCSCDDFYYQFDHGHLCYHIIAQKLAEALGQYDQYQDTDDLYNTLIKEWKTPEEHHHPAQNSEETTNQEDTI